MNSMFCDSLSYCHFHRCLQSAFTRSSIEYKNHIRHLHKVCKELARVKAERSGKPSSSEARSWNVGSWLRLREEQVRCWAVAIQALPLNLLSHWLV